MDWKIKLKAILHDSPHKQWIMFSEEGKKIKIDEAIHQDHQWHEKVAEHLLNYFIYGECIKEWKIEDADKIASALSRIIVTPNIQGEIKEEYKKASSVGWNEIKFTDSII